MKQTVLPLLAVTVIGLLSCRSAEEKCNLARTDAHEAWAQVEASIRPALERINDSEPTDFFETPTDHEKVTILVKGETRSVLADEARRLLMSGDARPVTVDGRVDVVNSDGKLGSVAADEIRAALHQGYKLATKLNVSRGAKWRALQKKLKTGQKMLSQALGAKNLMRRKAGAIETREALRQHQYRAWLAVDANTQEAIRNAFAVALERSDAAWEECRGTSP